MFRTDASPDPMFTDTLELDLGSVVPSISGPRRPQDRVPLTESKKAFREALPSLMKSGDAAKTVNGAVERRQVPARAWLGCDLGDHQLHQYFQSLGADRRGLTGEESGRERPHEQALGENQFGAGI